MTRTLSQKKRARAAAVQRARAMAPGTVTNSATKALQAQINNLQNKMNSQKTKSKKSMTSSKGKKKGRRVNAPSGYLKYVLYPEMKGGKIPDGTSMVPTATKQFVFRDSLFPASMNTNNGTFMAQGVRVDIPGSTGGFSASSSSPIRIYILGGSTDQNFNYQNATNYTMIGANTQVQQWFAAAQPSVYRIVSLAVVSTFTGNTTSDQGRCISWNDYDVNAPSSFNSFDNSDTVKRDRITNVPCKAIYRPLSVGDRNFNSVSSSDNGNTINWNVTSRPQSFGVYYQGVSNSFSMEYVVYLNIEYVPQSNNSTGMYSTTPALNNPAQMQETSSFFGKAAGYLGVPAMLAAATNYAYGRPLPPPSEHDRYVDGFLGLS